MIAVTDDPSAELIQLWEKVGISDPLFTEDFEFRGSTDVVDAGTADGGEISLPDPQDALKALEALE